MTLISSFRILISTPVMVSQECEKCFYWSSGHRKTTIAKALGQNIRINMYLFMLMITLKMFAMPQLKENTRYHNS